jgi:hypothetical protein
MAEQVVESPEGLRKVQEKIDTSILAWDSGAVYIKNPHPSLNPDTDRYLPKPRGSVLPTTCAITLQDLSGADQAVKRREYLKWGNDRLTKKEPFVAKHVFYGVCDDFAVLQAALLVNGNQKDLLPPGTVVEVCGTTSKKDGHTFVVVSRQGAGGIVPGGKIGAPATWGTQCFVLDQWYALQKSDRAVKSFNPQNAFYDKNFVTWLGELEGPWISVVTFAAGEWKAPVPGPFTKQKS